MPSSTGPSARKALISGNGERPVRNLLKVCVATFALLLTLKLLTLKVIEHTLSAGDHSQVGSTYMHRIVHRIVGCLFVYLIFVPRCRFLHRDADAKGPSRQSTNIAASKDGSVKERRATIDETRSGDYVPLNKRAKVSAKPTINCYNSDSSFDAACPPFQTKAQPATRRPRALTITLGDLWLTAAVADALAEEANARQMSDEQFAAQLPRMDSPTLGYPMTDNSFAGEISSPRYMEFGPDVSAYEHPAPREICACMCTCGERFPRACHMDSDPDCGLPPTPTLGANATSDVPNARSAPTSGSRVVPQSLADGVLPSYYQRRDLDYENDNDRLEEFYGPISTPGFPRPASSNVQQTASAEVDARPVPAAGSRVAQQSPADVAGLSYLQRRDLQGLSFYDWPIELHGPLSSPVFQRPASCTVPHITLAERDAHPATAPASPVAPPSPTDEAGPSGYQQPTVDDEDDYDWVDEYYGQVSPVDHECEGWW
ncbi:hypothetical protein MMC13_004599 [Lambiella insularis]|nr:hypothetical protein [Lambiella insularis]